MKIYYNTKVKIWKGILNVSEIDRKTYRNIEVFVMATMSSGKSTLINALLSKKLLPSSNEACTTTITKVINTNQDNKRIIYIISFTCSRIIFCIR